MTLRNANRRRSAGHSRVCSSGRSGWQGLAVVGIGVLAPALADAASASGPAVLFVQRNRSKTIRTP